MCNRYKLSSFPTNFCEIIDIDDEEYDLDTSYIWLRTGNGFKIQDLREKHFQPVLKLLEKEYITNDVLLKSVNLSDDKISRNMFLDRTLFHLQNMSSLVAIDESFTENPDKADEATRIAGILVLRVIKKYNFECVTSQLKMTNGDALRKCVKLRARLNRKINLYDKYERNCLMRFYDLCILPHYKYLGLSSALMKSAVELARTRGVQIIMGIFSNYYMQDLADYLGMKTCESKQYSKWKDRKKNQIFTNLGPDDISCKLMACEMPKYRPFPRRIAIPIPVPKVKKRKKKFYEYDWPI